jgi:hypothetical protein
VVRCSDPHEQHGNAGTDVFDLSCPNAQRLFSTVKKNKRREKNTSPRVKQFLIIERLLGVRRLAAALLSIKR